MSPRQSLAWEENPSVICQNTRNAIRVAVMAGGHQFGYALVSGTREEPDFQVFRFPDEKTLRLALSEPIRGYGHYDVFVFGPDEPVRLFVVIEDDDE